MKEEEIRHRSAFNRYLEIVTADVRAMFRDYSQFDLIGCPACGGDKHQFQFEKLWFKYVLCENCGTLFANPRPSNKMLIDYNTKSRSENYWINSFFKPVIEIRRKEIFKPRAELVQSRFPEIANGVIGDIGAGFGIFLEEIRKVWTDARLIVIESSPEMVDICKNKKLEVIPYGIEDVTGWDGKFDLLTSFEVMEHLHTPIECLKKAWDMLRPGGYLLLTTLNGEGFDIRILWDKSKSIMPPHHINFFNPKSLAYLAKESGFVVESVETPGKLDWNIVEGMYRKEGIDIGWLWKTFAERVTQETKDKLQHWISENGFSSHMRLIARKPN